MTNKYFHPPQVLCFTSEDELERELNQKKVEAYFQNGQRLPLEELESRLVVLEENLEIALEGLENGTIDGETIDELERLRWAYFLAHQQATRPDPIQ
jgi:hypothetical protein